MIRERTKTLLAISLVFMVVIQFNQVCDVTEDSLKIDVLHYTYKPVYVGEIRSDGQFEVIWKAGSERNVSTI